MKILFMGTPEFAMTCLNGLVEAGEHIVGVVTQPDKPKGRGYVLTPPPVKVYALERGIPVYQPESLRDGSFDNILRELDPEIICVVAYGKILPKSILDYPKYGCINVHSSILPAYRGAAPMQRAIIDGCERTGITTMYMAEGLDTGDILEIEECEIGINDDFESIHDRLAQMGARLLPHTVHALEKGEITAIPQQGPTCYAEKITKADTLIDWNRPARKVHDLVRGLCPIPLSYTIHAGKVLKVVRTELTGKKASAAPGEVVDISDGRIHVCCADEVIAITGVLPEGKGRMQSADFIRGRKIAVGDVLGE